MLWIKSVFVSVVLVTCVIGRSSALRCYQCKSALVDACADPFDKATASKVKTCTKGKDLEDLFSELVDAAVCYKLLYPNGDGNYSRDILII